MTDALTKLENRRALNNLCRAEKGKTTIGCLMIDVDNFKYFNDTFGHEKGDYVLKQIGEILLSARQSNIRAFRYGGDEFILICHEMTREEVLSLANRIKQQINQIMLPDGYDAVSITIGVCYKEKLQDISKVISLADEALMKGKEKKNVVIELDL